MKVIGKDGFFIKGDTTQVVFGVAIEDATKFTDDSRHIDIILKYARESFPTKELVVYTVPDGIFKQPLRGLCKE